MLVEVVVVVLAIHQACVFVCQRFFRSDARLRYCSQFRVNGEVQQTLCFDEPVLVMQNIKNTQSQSSDVISEQLQQKLAKSETADKRAFHFFGIYSVESNHLELTTREILVCES